MRRRTPIRRLAGLAVLPAAMLLASCFHTFWKTVASAVVPPDTGTVFIPTPLKVHLVDGRTVVFRDGGSIDRRAVTGSGRLYAMVPSQSDGALVERVSLDSVAGVETFEGKILGGQSVVVSVAATAVVAVASVVIFKAIFGSCPTVYADTGTGPVLEAEGFSYSIAPLLEQRDVDPLRVRPDSTGMIRLELRNEALETHYINHIELTAVRHPAGARVMPDQADHPVVVSDIRPLDAAHDRAGRDVRALLAAPDGALFSSDPRTTDAAQIGDLDDWIDLDARDLPPGDSVAVVLRLRNSLLSTVLLYDGMLTGRGAPVWLDTKLAHIASAVDLGTWYNHTMGLRASVDGVQPAMDGTSWTARLGDVGPIAFRDVALILPRPAHDARSLRVRLRFVADDWRIDYAAIGARTSRPRTATIVLHRVLAPARPGGADVVDDTAALSALREPDGRYLQTTPGQRMTLEFDASATRSDPNTTYLITWQGWYREWIRGQWLAEPTRAASWMPSDSSVVTAIRRWRVRQPELERTFYSTRVPVR